MILRGRLGMDESLLKLLAQTDTPTICNAIELAQGKRGFNAFTRGTMVPMHNSSQVAMGFARTAKIAAEAPTTLSDADNKALRMAYYEYMSEAGSPSICVIEDLDDVPVGAFWGEVNTTVHRGFGISGTLTNGVIRDIGMCPEDYQVIGGSIGPSHRFVHVREIGTTVNIFGMSVKEGDFVHADRHGAVVVPLDILYELDKWISKMQEIEEIVLAPARKDDFNFQKFEAAWAELEKKRV